MTDKNDLMSEKSRLRRLSYDCIFGINANPRMHPSWQREFLKNVEETIIEQDAHLIVNSHSPFIAASAKKSQLYVLNNEESTPSVFLPFFKPPSLKNGIFISTPLSIFLCVAI